MEEDFKCPLCMKLLYVPVSTSCGHTFCKSCIEECFSKYRQCPICRTPLNSKNLSPTFILQSIIERKHPEEYRQRQLEEEENAKSKQLKATTFAVVFLKDTVVFPGNSFTFHAFDEKYIRLFQSMNPGDHFAVLSFVENIWISWASSLQAFHGHTIRAKCLSRLSSVVARRVDEPRFTLTLGELTQEQVFDSSLYEVPLTPLSDLPCVLNRELLDNLLEFTHSCISKLTTTENTYLANHVCSSSLPSFFMLSVLKFPNNLLVQAFVTQDDNERLSIIQSHLKLKMPCRLHIKYSRETNTRSVYAAIAGIFLLLVISKIFA